MFPVILRPVLSILPLPIRTSAKLPTGTRGNSKLPLSSMVPGLFCESSECAPGLTSQKFPGKANEPDRGC